MKAYEKPMVFAESFELMEHISGICTEDFFDLATHRGTDKCGIAINGKEIKPYDLVFVTDTICNFAQIDEDQNGDCYQGVFYSEASVAFAS